MDMNDLDLDVDLNDIESFEQEFEKNQKMGKNIYGEFDRKIKEDSMNLNNVLPGVDKKEGFDLLNQLNYSSIDDIKDDI